MAKAREDRDDFDVVTIRLYKGDKDTLGAYFPKQGYNRVIRALVRKFILQVEATSPTKDSTDDITITLD